MIFSIFIFVHSISKNSKTSSTLLINRTIPLFQNKKIMITSSSFQCVLIVFQKLHDELLDREVNGVNQKTKERKAFVSKPLRLFSNFKPVLEESCSLSFKTTFSPHIISMHILSIRLWYVQK